MGYLKNIRDLGGKLNQEMAHGIILRYILEHSDLLTIIFLMSKNYSSFKPMLTSANRVLGPFANQLEKQAQLLALVKSVLPSDLVNYAQYCVISDQKVLIYTDSAVWASQLRFYTRAMFELIKSHSASVRYIEQVQIRILPSMPDQASSPNKAIVPSAKTTSEIRKDILGDSEDPLYQALSRLCSTLENLVEK